MFGVNPQELAVVFADEACVVIGKPPGLLSVPGRAALLNPLEGDCAATRVQALYPDARIVHRLDMATSGLMVFARGAACERAISLQFQERSVQKTYTAWVHGLPAQDSGEIDLPLSADWPRRPRQKVDLAAGKPSLTRWQVLRREPALGRTLLRLNPRTGRSHQLRVHLLEIGHPIVGDALYGSDDAPRLMLHATQLAFNQPVSGERLVFEQAADFGAGFE